MLFGLLIFGDANRDIKKTSAITVAKKLLSLKMPALQTPLTAGSAIAATQRITAKTAATKLLDKLFNLLYKIIMRTEAKAAAGILIAAGIAWGLSLVAQARENYEYSSEEKLGGYGYSILPSKFRPDLITLEGRTVLFPPQGPEGSLEKGRERLRRNCGGVIDEQPVPLSKYAVRSVIVGDRSNPSCLPNYQS